MAQKCCETHKSTRREEDVELSTLARTVWTEIETVLDSDAGEEADRILHVGDILRQTHTTRASVFTELDEWLGKGTSPASEESSNTVNSLKTLKEADASKKVMVNGLTIMRMAMTTKLIKSKVAY